MENLCGWSRLWGKGQRLDFGLGDSELFQKRVCVCERERETETWTAGHTSAVLGGVYTREIQRGCRSGPGHSLAIKFRTRNVKLVFSHGPEVREERAGGKA